jgi:hypothetical protein
MNNEKNNAGNMCDVGVYLNGKSFYHGLVHSDKTDFKLAFTNKFYRRKGTIVVETNLTKSFGSITFYQNF